MVKIGVFGAGRGEMAANFARETKEAELVAICDKNERLTEKFSHDPSITIYTDFDKFIEHDMDAVVLANFADEHAPYAIRCLKKGLHVLSEVLPVATLKEAVELVEAVEESGKIYSYAENYCYMPATMEMRRLYKSGKLGELEYAEGEYLHNCLPIWAEITGGDPDHWRNRMSANYYCTHSIGPIIHATGLRPETVMGFELPYSPKKAIMGARSGAAGIEMVTLSNGAVLRSTHGNLCKNSIWFSVYGTKGRIESARENTGGGDMFTVFCDLDTNEVSCDGKVQKYTPTDPLGEKAKGLGHNNSDYYPLHHFIEAIKGDEKAETIDVYEALDMALPGIIGYRSVLEGAPLPIPDMRDKAARDAIRNDDKRVGRDLPSYSKNEIIVDDSVYVRLKKILKNQEKKQ